MRSAVVVTGSLLACLVGGAVVAQDMAARDRSMGHWAHGLAGFFHTAMSSGAPIRRHLPDRRRLHQAAPCPLSLAARANSAVRTTCTTTAGHSRTPVETRAKPT